MNQFMFTIGDTWNFMYHDTWYAVFKNRLSTTCNIVCTKDIHNIVHGCSCFGSPAAGGNEITTSFMCSLHDRTKFLWRFRFACYRLWQCAKLQAARPPSLNWGSKVLFTSCISIVSNEQCCSWFGVNFSYTPYCTPSGDIWISDKLCSLHITARHLFVVSWNLSSFLHCLLLCSSNDWWWISDFAAWPHRKDGCRPQKENQWKPFLSEGDA